MLPNNPSPRRQAVNPFIASTPSKRSPLRQLPSNPGAFAGAPSSSNGGGQQPRVPPAISVPPKPSSVNFAPLTASTLSARKSPLVSRFGEKASPQSASSKGQTLLAPRSHFSFASNMSPYSSTSTLVSVNGQISKAADPDFWEITPGTPGSAADDWLHNPDPRRDRKGDRGGPIFTVRGFQNVGCLFIFILGVIALFAVYPIVNHYAIDGFSTLGAFNIGGTNASGQIPSMNGNFGLIDKDTPQSVYTIPSYQNDGTSLQLVFSDEFEVDGRTFYPGDDPYWQAENLHYWETGDLEWYDPAAVTTRNGSMVITFSKTPEYGLEFQSGLVSTWNKFCFTGGLVQVSIILPGSSKVQGFWPAVWSMGNLGRMGYGASLEGMWPYSYDSCDVGTLPNQTFPNGTPTANTVGNDPANNGALSFLPGQKLSSCTCAGEDHPGPQTSNGSFVGRGVPEIDILEATIDPTTGTGEVSQSAQWAPFNSKYIIKQNATTLIIHEPEIAIPNAFVGGVFQQTTSVLVDTNSNCNYEQFGSKACFEAYGFQYEPGVDGYITWVSSGKASWTLSAQAVGPDPVSGANQRQVSEEPMYIIANLGMSPGFSPIDFAHLQFPAHMYIDYVRVYQPADKINIGCSPKDFPTADYIQNHIEAYTNANLTTWAQYGATFPKNRLVDQC